MMKRSCLLTGVAALAILLGQSSQVFGYSEYYAYGNYYGVNNSVRYESDDSDDAYVHYNSHAGGNVVTIDRSYATISGRADAANLNLGIHGSATSLPTNSSFTDTYMYTKASNRFTVSPGTSGLANGDVTTLQLKIRLDGTLHAEATSWPGKGWAHADMDASLAIHDYSIQDCLDGDGCWSPTQASFGASSEIEAYDVYSPYWGYSYYGYWGDDWQTSSNVSPYDSYHDLGEHEEHDESFHYEEGHSFDTGVLTLEFEAIVGHTLDLDAFLDVYVNANHDGKAWADFANSLAFGVTPTIAGTQIDWEIGSPQTQPVPLPGALPLLGSGLLGLIGLRRRWSKGG